MRIRMPLSSAIALLALVGSVRAGGIPSYYQQLNYNLTSPTAFTTAAGGFANPAVYSMMPGSEFEAYFGDPKHSSVSGLDNWGGFIGLKALGFGWVHERAATSSGTTSVTDYRFALSGGTAGGSVGIAYAWSSGDRTAFDRTSMVQIGLVKRYTRYFSFGASGLFSTQVNSQTGLFDIAYRPLGDQRFTVFGDLEYPPGVKFTDSPWSVGAMVEVPTGVKFIGRYFESEAFSVAFAYTFGGGANTGGLRGSVQPYYSKDGVHGGTNWGVRLGYPERNGLIEGLFDDYYYVRMELRGKVQHTRFRYFDSAKTFSAVMAALDGALTDPRVAGVALSLSTTEISRGNAWELREKLAELRRSGKRVVVYLDDAGMTEYHVASVADRVVLDPEGLLVLPGYVMSRTYLSRLTEKLGLGVEEWRFKDYKSAMEGFVRRGMSDADREQRQALVDEYYRTFRDEVASGRNLEAAAVDGVVNDAIIIRPVTAKSRGLVDNVSMWEDIGDVIEELESSRKAFMAPRSTANYAYPSTRWGEPDQIAVIYAIGGTETDSGMNARWLAKTIRRAAANPSIKAVVLRVNSPGGSPLAANMVAEAIRVCRRSKPVVASQADVAASGGYWVSMYADEIVAQPTTITGSIGVIAGWIWDDGISDKMGLDHDHVKAGDHADVFATLKLPLLPVTIPHRRITDDERKLVLGEMESLYNEFVAKVAEGRGMTKEAVEKIAKGRVWTGTQGLENGLVDRIGGLETAIDAARERAGLAPDDFEVVEFGVERGLFDLGALKPIPMGWLFNGSVADEESDALSGFQDNYDMFYLRMLAEAGGRALCILPPEYFPRESGR